MKNHQLIILFCVFFMFNGKVYAQIPEVSAYVRFLPRSSTYLASLYGEKNLPDRPFGVPVAPGFMYHYIAGNQALFEYRNHEYIHIFPSYIFNSSSFNLLKEHTDKEISEQLADSFFHWYWYFLNSELDNPQIEKVEKNIATQMKRIEKKWRKEKQGKRVYNGERKNMVMYKERFCIFLFNIEPSHMEYYKHFVSHASAIHYPDGTPPDRISYVYDAKGVF